MRTAIRSIGLVSTAVLARLLVPADFGLVAMAMAFYGLVELASAFNFHIVLIQKQDAGRDYYDTAWTLNILRGGATTVLLCALARPAAALMLEPRLEWIIYAVSATALIGGFGNVGVVAFQKELNFRQDFKLQVASKLASFVVTLSLAYWWRSYWALVCGTLAAAWARFFLSYAMHTFRPRWSLARAREILAFSKWLLASNFLSFVYLRADPFIIGRIVGASILGTYTVALEISSLATTELVAPIRRALMPGYAKLSGDAGDFGDLRQSFMSGFGLIILLATPMVAGIAVTSDLIVRVFLGAQWLAVIPLLQVLCLRGVLQLTSANTHPLFLAMGRPHLTTIVVAVGAVLSPPAVFYGTSTGGAIGAAWATAAVSAVTAVVNLAVAFPLIGMRVRDVTNVVWRPVLGVVVMVAGVRLVVAPTGDDASMGALTASLAVSVLTGIALFVGTVLLSWTMSGRPSGPESIVLAEARRARRR